MNVSVGDYWEEFISGAVKSGRFGSASEVVRAGLRSLHAQEQRIKTLQEIIQASLARGGEITGEELDREIETWDSEAKAEGH